MIHEVVGDFCVHMVQEALKYLSASIPLRAKTEIKYQIWNKIDVLHTPSSSALSPSVNRNAQIQPQKPEYTFLL